MKNKTSKSISHLSHALIVNDAIILTNQLSQIKGGFVISDEITGF